MWFSADSGCVVDQMSLLTALTVFLLSAGPDVCTVEPMHTLCLQRFTVSMDSKDPQVGTRDRLRRFSFNLQRFCE